MNRQLNLILILTAGLLMGAGIPNFFAGLIGDNIKDYCDMNAEEQYETMKSINLYTGAHKVMVVCGENLAQADTPGNGEKKHSRKIAR